MQTPSQELPKNYDHIEAQRRWYAFWEEKGYFHSEPDSSKKPYTIVIPPPNVTGALHLGHALNNTLQDILIRMKRMQGFNTLWMPGTDHAGIATQAIVERRLLEEENLTRHDLGREALVARIWKWKEQYEARIIGQLKQMGFSCDWQRTRFTLDPVCARAVRQTFCKLFEQQLVYRGKRLVNWDTFLQTAVSDDEVFHETVQGHFWHFKYPVIDPKPGEPEYVTIATTRPETMLGDTAVAVHPDPAAALDKVAAELQQKLGSAPEKDREAIANQLDEVAERQKTHLAELEQLRDMALDGRMLMLPLMDREIPLVADRWAKPEMGSGCVKITPAHDPNDYEVGQRQHLPMINILNPDGTLNENAAQYQGLNIATSRKRVVANMDEAGLLLEVEDREIDLAHSDRSKTPIEPYLVDQWFVKMDSLAQTAIDAVTDERVKIFPSRYTKGYLDWLGEKRDWPVGRQLWWGHRIPIWSRVAATREELESILAELKNDTDVAAGRAIFQVEQSHELETGNSDNDLPRGEETVGPAFATIHLCIDEGHKSIEKRFESLGFVQVSDVLDTWFSSALWPHSTLGWPEETAELKHYYPTSALITSRDIISLWVARMVLAGLFNMEDIPFREVYIHPKILDRYGEGMSKSKGNGVDPLDVVEKFGADSLRFGIAYLTTETQDIRMAVDFECPHCQSAIEQTKKNRMLPRIDCPKCGKPFGTQWAETESDKALARGPVIGERFELGRNFCNKLWNASRFALMNLEGYTPGPVADNELAIEDRWILSRLSTVTLTVTEALESYKYADAARALYDFAWDEFCSFYLEMIKGRLQDDQQKVVAQRVLAHSLDTLLRLLHPMIPFLTEEVWQLLKEAAHKRGLSEPTAQAESIMIATWPEPDPQRRDSDIERQFSLFQAVLSGLREIRSRQSIPPRQPIDFCVKAESQVVDLLLPMESSFVALAGAQAVAWGPDVVTPETSANVSVSGAVVYVDMKDLIDVDAELARNKKEAERLTKLIASGEKKLASPAFVERAPAQIVQKQREHLEQNKDDLATVQAAIDGLRDGIA